MMKPVYLLSLLFPIIFIACEKTDEVQVAVNEKLANASSYIFKYLGEEIDLLGEDIVQVEFKNNNYTIKTSHSTYEGKYRVLALDRIGIEDREWKILQRSNGSVVLETSTYNPLYQVIRNETKTFFHLFIGTEKYSTELPDESVLFDSRQGSLLGAVNNYDNLEVSFHPYACEYPEHQGNPVYGSTPYDLTFSVLTPNLEKLAVGTFPADLLSFYAPNEDRTGVYLNSVSFSNDVFQWKYSAEQASYRYVKTGKTGELMIDYFDGVRIKGNFVALLTACDSNTNHSDKKIQVSGNFSFKDHVAFLNKLASESK
jgi:hypothetical protein